MQVNKFRGKINFAEINFTENQLHGKINFTKNQFHGKINFKRISILRKNQFHGKIKIVFAKLKSHSQSRFVFTIFFAKIIQIFIKLIFTRNWWSVKVNFREIEIQCLPFLQNSSQWNRFMIKRFAIRFIFDEIEFPRNWIFLSVVKTLCAADSVHTLTTLRPFEAF